MAARDGTYRDGLYHFDCESCGGPATARRAHALTCSSACAARLRRRRVTPPSRRSSSAPRAPTEVRFYISRKKLAASLAALDSPNRDGDRPELVVGFHRDGLGPEIARLVIELTDHDDGGLVCSLTAPYDPFDHAKRASRSPAARQP